MEFKPKLVPGAVFWAGFDPEFENLPIDARSAREIYGITSDEIVVFYSGNVHHSNVAEVRILYLAVSLLRARGRKIRLLRTGWNHVEIDIPKDKIVAEAIKELGFVNRSDIPILLGLSDLLIQPGHSDPFNNYRFPSKLPEYLVSGKPVILPACNIGNALDDGLHVLKLYNGSLVELLDKIERMLDDPSMAQRLGEEARAFALSNLRWSRAAKIVSEMYARVHCQAAPVLRSEDRSEEILRQHPVKLIAFYDPQPSSVFKNDKRSGNSFTDYRNASNVKPHTFGQLHPHIYAERSCYDARLVKTMHQQSDLAKGSGISGFCFYIKWSEVRRLSGQLVDLWMEQGPDFPFCVCWNNEKWSRHWCGSTSEPQSINLYSSGFEERFILDMLPILKDPRYIRVNGAPMLAVYRMSELPQPLSSAQALRFAAAKHGLPMLHLVMVQTCGLSDPRPYGCDAAIEVSPADVNRLLLDPKLLGGASSCVEDYVGLAVRSINAPQTAFLRYRSCFPMWDSTAGRSLHGHTFVNDSPKAYGNWLRFLVNETMRYRNGDNKLIFINRWKPWAADTYAEALHQDGQTLVSVTLSALVHGIADYAQGGSSPNRDREFSYRVSRLRKG